MGFLGRAVCDSGASCGPDLVVRGSSVARVAPTFLYEFAAGFLFRCCSVGEKFSSVRGEKDLQISLGRFSASPPPLVHLAPDYFSVAK